MYNLFLLTPLFFFQYRPNGEWQLMTKPIKCQNSVTSRNKKPLSGHHHLPVAVSLSVIKMDYCRWNISKQAFILLTIQLQTMFVKQPGSFIMWESIIEFEGTLR